MYFGQGPLATELAAKPGFWYLDRMAGARLDAGQLEVVDSIVSEMREGDPHAFAAAAKRMTSGDPYVVSAEMQRLNASFESAVEAVADEHAGDPSASDATVASPVVVVAVVFHAGVAVTGVAVGVVAVAVANSVVWHNQVKVTSRVDRPGGEERFLAEVTASLAA